MPKRRSRIAAGLTLGALLLAIVPAAAASPTGASAAAAGATAAAAPSIQPALSWSYWGWVTVRSPGTSNYTPAAIDRGNSEGRTNLVKRLGVGHWKITFNGIGDDGGIAHVTPIGTTARICSIEGWGRGSGTKETVNVDCFRMSDGSRADTMFSVTWFMTNIDAGPFAYLFAYGDVAEQDADPQYSYNSTFGINHISRTGTGEYTVTLGGLSPTTGGHPQVTVRTSPFTPGVTCNINGWVGASINVTCRNRIGLPRNSEFTLSFTDQQGLKGHNTAKVAYLWADQPSSASYVPMGFYRYSSASQTSRITRQSQGRYTVKLNGMPKGGAVQVVAYGADPVRCQLASIRTSGTPQLVKVRCYELGNAPIDYQFNLSYER